MTLNGNLTDIDYGPHEVSFTTSNILVWSRMSCLTYSCSYFSLWVLQINPIGIVLNGEIHTHSLKEDSQPPAPWLCGWSLPIIYKPSGFSLLNYMLFCIKTFKKSLHSWLSLQSQVQLQACSGLSPPFPFLSPSVSNSGFCSSQHHELQHSVGDLIQNPILMHCDRLSAAACKCLLTLRRK
jgi:hypothetical protein